MGLDTPHDCWHGPYSSFNRWRNRVAQAAGYPVGTPDGDYMTQVLLDYSPYTHENYFGKWEIAPAEPMIVLICHSDCDGYIYPEHAGPLADRLKELLPLLQGEDDVWFLEKTKQFIKGLKKASKRNQKVEFG